MPDMRILQNNTDDNREVNSFSIAAPLQGISNQTLELLLSKAQPDCSLSSG